MPRDADQGQVVPEDRLVAVMTAPLDVLVDGDVRVLPPASAMREWHLPANDLRTLAEWGLPRDVLMTPRFQAESEPVLVPNVAGPAESRLITPADRLYRLGRWGGHDRTPWMGAVAGDGRVLAIRDRPVTAQDLHPALREFHRDLYHPAVDFINSSVARLVEISWRWRAALHILRTLEHPPAAAPLDAHEAFDNRVSAAERIVLKHIVEIDSHVRLDDPASLWVQLVTDPGY
ncbi:SUKH-4 family immunity protein [Actinophytocola sediminis]